MPSASNIPATRPRWSKTWLRYRGWLGMTISPGNAQIVKGLQRNTTIPYIGKGCAERRIDGPLRFTGFTIDAGCLLSQMRRVQHPMHAGQQAVAY